MNSYKILTIKSVRQALKDWNAVKSLGSSPLADLGIIRSRLRAARYPGTSLGSGLALREVFGEAIESLKPADIAFDPRERKWRPYTILKEQYLRGRTPESVATEMCVSRSVYFSEQNRALGLLVDFLHQREMQAAPEEPPSLRGLHASRHNIPLQATSFIGREKELAKIKHLLTTQRLVTLTGPGGVGKTRLSIQAAAELIDAFPDGVWMVALAALSDPTLLPHALTAVFSLQETHQRPLLDTIQEYLCPRHILLLLDNCEHMTEPVAHLVDGLLGTCPHLTVLASSRELLGVPGEAHFRVPPLAAPDPQHLPDLENIHHYDAVQLFAERAQIAWPDFQLTPANVPAVAQICQRLDGIPLALELAAARVGALSVEQIAARLYDRFRLLTGGSRTALPRQQTLRALIDWSWNLLSDDEQAALRRLSVFNGDWSLAAAEAVVGGNFPPAALQVETWQVLDLLASLANKSLLIVDQHTGPEARYTMLETIRQYGREKLFASPEAKTTRRLHLAYYVDWAENVRNQESKPAPLASLEQRRAAYVAIIQPEMENLCAAIEWAQQSDPATGLRICAALRRPIYRSGRYVGEGRIWLKNLLAAGGSSLPEPMHGNACIQAARLAWEQSDHAQGYQYATQALESYRRIDDQPGIATALNEMGIAVEWGQKDFVAACELQTQAAAIFRKLGDTARLAFTLNCLAGATLGLEKLEEAESLFRTAEELYLQQGDEGGSFGPRAGLAEVHVRRGNYAEALAIGAACLANAERRGNTWDVAYSLSVVERIAWLSEEWQTAEQANERALPLWLQLGDREMICKTLALQATHAYRHGEVERAARLLGAVESSLVAGGRSVGGEQGALTAFWEESHSLAIRRMVEEVYQAVQLPTLEGEWAAGQTMDIEQAVAYAQETRGASFCKNIAP